MTQLCMLVVLFGISAYAQSIVPQKDEKKGLWGYVSKSDGKWVVKPKFDEATELTASPNGQLRGTVTQKGKKGFIDDSGKILGAGIVFEEITPMQGDAMFVKVKGKTGVADYSGVYKVKPEAENVEQLGDEGWIVTMKGKKGLLKNDGTWLIDPIYNEIHSSTPGFFIVDKGGKAGIFDRNGQAELAPGDFSKVEKLGDFWKVYKGDKVGLFDLENKALKVEAKYSDVDLPIKLQSDVWYPVKKDGKQGFLYSNGKWVIKPEYSSYFILSDPQAIVLSENNVPAYIYFPGDKNIGKLVKYNKDKQYIFEVLDLIYDRDGSLIKKTIVSLPDGRSVNSPMISKEGEFYEVAGDHDFSLWDTFGNMVYEKKDNLDIADKYIIFSELNKEDQKWQSYVDILKKNVIEDFNKKTGMYACFILKRLIDAKNQIGEGNLIAILGSYPIEKRALLIEAAYRQDKDLGLYLWDLYDNDEFSTDDKDRLFKLAEATGLIKDFNIGDFKYKILNRREVSAKYLGSAANVVFPSSVSDDRGNEYSVTEVLGVDNKDSIVSVEIPSSVKKIGDDAFADSKKLTTIKAPESVAIGHNAFKNCINLNYFNNSIFSPDVPQVLYRYIDYTYNCPKIFAKISSKVEAGFTDPYKLILFAYQDLLGLDKMYGDTGTLCYHDDMKKYGADILRRYVAKGNPDAMVCLLNTMCHKSRREFFKESEFIQTAKKLVAKKPALGYYFMGLAYEVGMGVKPSRSTAHSYYAKGRELNDSDCDDGYWRTF